MIALDLIDPVETWTCLALYCRAVYTERPDPLQGCRSCGRAWGYRHDQPMTLVVGDVVDGLRVEHVGPDAVELVHRLGVRVRLRRDPPMGWTCIETLRPAWQAQRWGGLGRTDWRRLLGEVAHELAAVRS